MKKLVIILTLPLLILMNLYSQEFVNSSVLSAGKWHRIKTAREGIYRIDFEDLSLLGLNPGDEVALYSNNYGLLSYYNDDPRPDDLVKTAIHIERGQDGIFNSGDYILFYGNSTHRFKYNHNSQEYYFLRHHYSDTAVYFIKFNEAPLETSQQAVPGPSNNVSEASDYLFIHEVEKSNIMKSGREWYEPLAAGTAYDIVTDLEDFNIREGAGLRYVLRVLGRSPDQAIIRLHNHDEPVSSVSLPAVNINNQAGTYASLAEEEGETDLSSGKPALSITYYNNGNLTARAWLDYLMLQTRVENDFFNPGTKHFLLRDKSTVLEANITEFILKSEFNNLLIWDISDEQNVKRMQAAYSFNEYSFTAATDSLKKFIAFRIQDAMKAQVESRPLPNQDLHKPGQYDMIILSHPLFMDYASELADLHSLNDSYQCILVSPEQIYNEFSGGIPDISAIRNYIRMIYSRNKEGERPLRYLLLFGDGSHENKTLPPDNPNYIPTYQTQNSNINTESFTSDDYYGLLDPGEGEYHGYLDIGIGRLPVSDTTEAGAIIRKIRDYISPENTGPWRNIIAMVADDEDDNIHMYDSDRLADLIAEEEPAFNIEKIYLDSYKQETSIAGQSYPEAVKDINERVNNGCLILNYSGHGNETGLAHERVVTTETINSWANRRKYPAFVTATCEFSRFDDIEIKQGTGEISRKTSAGEMALLNEEGGAIALFSTTRIVFASHNYTLASNLYEQAFEKDEQGKGLTMGEIMRRAKINTSGSNKRNFTLLGDPALRLEWAWHGKVLTDSINETGISVFNDTIRGLSEISISGHIEDNEGKHLQSFNGILYPSLYDKKHTVSSLANDGGSPFVYMEDNRVLFKGKTEIKNGSFAFSIFVPGDIDYTYGRGMIRYFAADENSSYTGSYGNFLIGGLSKLSTGDTTGPSIRLFLNDTLFTYGGICGPDPVLLAHLSDPSSINTAGTGLGHDIVALLDNDSNKPIILNNYYENDLGTYKSGKIIYPFHRLDRGEHLLTLKAWDNYNNSSTASLMLFVRDEDGLVLNKLINYPNPFTSSTSISVEHNRPDNNIEVIINIYSLSGELVKTIKTAESPGGYRISPVRWDGRDNNGGRVAGGIYVYNLLFRTGAGETARVSGRMIIL
ncbi:MAG: type IX secretion system sortase PorU [Bacteroidales bacterium]|nr:type IX secretion system sortase PorU [Bacteroidales bacterium]